MRQIAEHPMQLASGRLVVAGADFTHDAIGTAVAEAGYEVRS